MHNTIVNLAEVQARAIEAFAIELNVLADAALAAGRYSAYSAFVIAASEAPSFAAKLRSLDTQDTVENSNNINEH